MNHVTPNGKYRITSQNTSDTHSNKCYLCYCEIQEVFAHRNENEITMWEFVNCVKKKKIILDYLVSI